MGSNPVKGEDFSKNLDLNDDLKGAHSDYNLKMLFKNKCYQLHTEPEVH